MPLAASRKREPRVNCLRMGKHGSQDGGVCGTTSGSSPVSAPSPQDAAGPRELEQVTLSRPASPPHVGQVAPHAPLRALGGTRGAHTRRTLGHAPSHGPAGICGHPHCPVTSPLCGRRGLHRPPGVQHPHASRAPEPAGWGG